MLSPSFMLVLAEKFDYILVLYCRKDILIVSNEPSVHTWLFKNKVSFLFFLASIVFS